MIILTGIASLFRRLRHWLHNLTATRSTVVGLVRPSFVVTREFSDSLNLRHTKCQHEFNVLRVATPLAKCPICGQP